MATLEDLEAAFLPPDGDLGAEPEPAPEPFPADPNGVTLWGVGTWGELPNYVCGFCPFASISEQEIGEHVYARHMHEPAVESPKPRVDRYGNLT